MNVPGFAHTSSYPVSAHSISSPWQNGGGFSVIIDALRYLVPPTDVINALSDGYSKIHQKQYNFLK